MLCKAFQNVHKFDIVQLVQYINSNVTNIMNMNQTHSAKPAAIEIILSAMLH